MNQTLKIALAFDKKLKFKGPFLPGFADAIGKDASSVYRWARDNGGTKGRLP